MPIRRLVDLKGAYNDIFLRLKRSITAGILTCMLLPFYFALYNLMSTLKRRQASNYRVMKLKTLL